MKKAVITVIGKDTVGILARTCTYLADANVNILDISQTVVKDYFTMMMVVDVAGARMPFAELAAGLEETGLAIGVQIKCQKEEIFDKMHRI